MTKRRRRKTHVSKQDVRRYADEMAKTTTSHGTKIDPAALTERIWETIRYCALCYPGREPAYVWGMWTPSKFSDPVVRTGLADHQARVIHYGLCSRCYRRRDAHTRVEEV
jgi:hypothetical protein